MLFKVILFKNKVFKDTLLEKNVLANKVFNANKRMLPLCMAAILAGVGSVASAGHKSLPLNETAAEVFQKPSEAALATLQYVDPMIGTGGHGHTFPGAVVPFGMVQLSPDNLSKGWDWTSGYHYSDTEMLGFSHTHLSGTGVGDLLDILVMPFRGDYTQRREAGKGHVVSTYSHDKETATPGYYSVELPQEGVKAELTATARTGVHRYQFAGDEPANVLIDLGYAQNYDKSVATLLRVVDDRTIAGYRISTGWAKHQPVYFVATFSQPFEHQLYIEGKPIKGQLIQGENAKISEIVLTFKDGAQKEIEAKVGLSYVSIKGAQKNLLAETKGKGFDAIKTEAEYQWANQLGKFHVVDKDAKDKVQTDKTAIDKIKTDKTAIDKVKTDKTKFYTALYHSYLAPQTFNDVDGAFYGADGSGHHHARYDRYSLFSLWDTFRALHPLLTITDGERVNDMVKSMIGFYEETGVLPTWDLMSNETDVMIGYHAVPVIVDAYFKGLTDAAPETLYAAVKASAMQKRFGIDLMDKYGYIPSELEVEAVSKTLEYAFDDWAIARLAKALGKEKDYAYFSKRAESYKTLFDKKTGFMRGKTADGEWVKNFSPTFVEHRKTDYTEANAWQYTWFVPHDVNGLIDLFGDETSFVNKLDELFTTSSAMEGDVSPDISGLIGQYAHGNEPCHHIPYLYSLTSQAEKGQDKIREIREVMYKAEPDGLAGNDDVGQMSAWYVFSVLGFYPLNPADGNYVFGSPLFNETRLNLPNGNTLTVKKEGDNGNNHIKRVERNGKPLDVAYLTHQQLMAGGTLSFFYQ